MQKSTLFILIGSAVLVVVMVLVLVLNREDQPQDRILTIWSPFNEESVYNAILADFRANNPRTTVNFRYIQADNAEEYEAIVVNAIAERRGPDIWVLRSDWVPKHYNKLFPIAGVTQNANNIAPLKERIIPSVVDMGVYYNNIFGVPFAADTLVLIHNNNFYNQLSDINPERWQAMGLDQPPKTWRDLQNQSARMAQFAGRTVQNINLGTTSTLASTDILLSMLNQRNITVFNSERDAIAFNLADYTSGQPVFAAQEALDVFTSFARPGTPNYNNSDKATNPYQQFINGEIGSIIGYFSTYNQILRDRVDMSLSVSALPQLSTDTQRIDYGVAWIYGVNNNSPNRNLAWGLINFSLTSDNALDFYSQNTGRLSILAPTSSRFRMDDLAEDREEVVEIFTGQLMLSRQYYKPEWQRFDEIIQDMIHQVIVLGQTPQNAVDSAAQRMRQFLVF